MKKKVQLSKKISFKNNLTFSAAQKKTKKNENLLILNFKYAERIGYSGENTEKIISQIFKTGILKKINFNDIIKTIFLAHTRWASVGEVNLSNTHPVIDKNSNEFNLAIMNGDINNYKNIISDLKKNHKYKFNDKDCSNDLQPISSLIYSYPSKIEKILNGSYVLVNFNSKKPFDFTIYKKGSQGLYCTLDEDENIHLASDVYGLLNKSNKFFKISDDGKFEVNKIFHNKIKNKKFHKSDLMTNDLSKKGFDRFFLKEIDDTDIFLKRTINNYLSFNKAEFKNLNYIFNNKTLKKFKERKINNIILTGMGSCYSAAVGISKYLRRVLIAAKYNDIKIEATVASEGSGFYLSDNMEDTIIIVLAQSGTTIDTNVFAKLARERGAYTIALVNKKEGDVTFIVEKSFYLGNGRDVEISVPSTKTYTCHLIMGYILSEKICELISRKKNKSFFLENKEIINTNFLKEKKIFLANKINSFYFDIFKFKNWIVLYDDSENAFTALELRIKISECCYKSVPYCNLKNFDSSKFKNSLIIYIGTNKLKLNEYNSSNYYISISRKNISKKLGNSFNVNLNEKKIINLTIETSLALQLLSYRLSELIDRASKKIKDGKNIKSITNFLIDKYDHKLFLKKNIKKKREILIEKIKRPIDAIKHQAKTVTVGATRAINYDYDYSYEEKNVNSYLEKKNSIFFDNKIKLLSNKTEIKGDVKFDTYKYFIGNLIEYHNHIYKKKNHFKIITDNQNNLKHSKNSIILLNQKNLEIKKKSSQKFKKKFLNSHDILKTFLPNDKYSIKNELSFMKAKIEIKENQNYYKMDIKKLFDNFNNIKFLGSGINYLVAKKYAQHFSNKYNISVAFDVIENHKHIDISSESLIFIFASNINRSGFQSDVYSETEKFIAHNNRPIIFTNFGNNIYDNLLVEDKILSKRVIKLPRVDEIYSLSIFEFLFDNFII